MNKLFNFLNKTLVWIIMAIVVLINLIVLNFITFFPSSYYERPLEYTSNIFLVLISIVFLALLIFLERKNKIKMSNLTLLKILLIYSFLVSLIWLFIARSYPVADQNYISVVASQMMSKYYGGFRSFQYIYKYPHQIGITLFVYIIYSIFGVNNYLAFGVINAIAISMVLYILYKVTCLIFNDEKIEKYILIFSFFMFPLFLYTPFVYGNIISLLFSLIAIYFVLLYLKKDQLKYQLLSTMSIVIAIILKSNSLIFLLGIAILLFLHGIKKKSIATFGLIILLFIGNFLGSFLITKHFQNLTGEKLDNGIPKIAYVAMGLQEGTRAPGWYNWYVENVYAGNDFDSKEARVHAINYIKERAKYLSNHPGYTVRFFSQKLISIWADPTFQGLWINNNTELTDRHYNIINYNIFYGPINFIIVIFLYAYELLLVSLATFYLVIKRKNLDYIKASLGVIIVGGFLFHIIWEGKGQYTLSYYILFLPYGGAGFVMLYNMVKKYLD